MHGQRDHVLKYQRTDVRPDCWRAAARALMCAAARVTDGVGVDLCTLVLRHKTLCTWLGAVWFGTSRWGKMNVNIACQIIPLEVWRRGPPPMQRARPPLALPPPTPLPSSRSGSLPSIPNLRQFRPRCFRSRPAGTNRRVVQLELPIRQQLQLLQKLREWYRVPACITIFARFSMTNQ